MKKSLLGFVLLCAAFTQAQNAPLQVYQEYNSWIATEMVSSDTFTVKTAESIAIDFVCPHPLVDCGQPEYQLGEDGEYTHALLIQESPDDGVRGTAGYERIDFDGSANTATGTTQHYSFHAPQDGEITIYYPVIFRGLQYQRNLTVTEAP